MDVIAVAYAAASLRNESSNYYCHGPGKKTPSWASADAGEDQSRAFFARLFTIEYMDLAEQVVPFLLFSLYMISHPHYLKKNDQGAANTFTLLVFSVSTSP